MSDDGVRIGLEVHIYLRTRSKLFCACPADFLAAKTPNANVCEVCTGQPGAKPMAPNGEAMRHAARLARALGGTPRPRARFLRKHYFYPDLPANYQRTSEPVATGGSLAGVRLRELHVEEDPGAYDLATGLVDDNRAGAPLIELVTEPDLDSPAHARRFLQELRLVLAYLGAWREEAGVKADCNVSVAGGERAEVKNVNSLRNVERAIAFEVERQLAARAKGERQARETRGFDEQSGTTVKLREKESEADYRYIGDPDVAPVDLGALFGALDDEEAPLARRARLAVLVGVAEDDASPLFDERALVDAFEEAAALAGARPAFDFVLRDVRGELEFRKTRLSDAPVAPASLARLCEALAKGSVTPHAGTRVLRALFEGGDLDALLAKEAGTVADDAVETAVRDALAANPRAVADFKAGKQAAVNFLVGQAMRALRGRADANALRERVEAALQLS